jgi:hypothetical protein
MAPLPLIKIGAVLWKEISKPLASKIKEYATSHPFVRTLAMSLGRMHEQASQQLESMWAGRGFVRSLRPVSESTAFSVGTDLLSQGFMLSTAIGIVLFEYWRADQQKAVETAEKAAQKAARRALKEARLRDLERNLADLQARLTVEELHIEDLQSRRPQPWQEQLR